MKRRVVIFIACWFFAGGIIIASFLPKNCLFFGLYYFSVAVFFLIFALNFWKKKNIRAMFIWAAFLFFGSWRFAVSLPINSPEQIFYYNGHKTDFLGVVSAEPTTKGASQKLEVVPLLLKEGLGVVKNLPADQNHSPKPLPDPSLERRGDPLEGGVPVNGKILVIASAYPQYNYGDVLQITCKLEEPQNFADFDYEKYLAAQGIYSTCSFPQIVDLNIKSLPPEILKREKSLTRFDFLFGGIYKIRESLSATIDNGLTEPEAGLLKAFILNDPTVPDDLNLSFRQSGLAHIVAISGSHISELIGIAFFCLLFLGLNRRHAFWFCVPLIIFYVALVGSPASALRAGLMGFLVLLAMYLGRLSRLDYTLALAGLVMLLFNPMLVIADAGFQLSFLAVLGMIYLYPVFDKYLKKFYENTTTPQNHPQTPPLKGGGILGKEGSLSRRILKILCQTAALTIAAQVFTAPILIFGFHQISFIAPIANLFALWAAPFIMISAFIAMALSAIIPAGAICFFIPTDIFIKYLIAVAQISAQIPFAYWKISI